MPFHKQYAALSYHIGYNAQQHSHAGREIVRFHQHFF